MRPEFKGRQATIYLDTHADLVRWKKLAKPNTLNRWVIETVEAAIEAPRPKSSNGEEINQLRKENLDLRQEVERLAARLREAEEVYEKTAHTIHSPQLDRNVVDLLRSGGTWTSPKITEQLLTADKDTYKKFFTESHNELNKVDHAKSISRTLELLEQAGLVEQTERGWIWNK